MGIFHIWRRVQKSLATSRHVMSPTQGEGDAREGSGNVELPYQWEGGESGWLICCTFSATLQRWFSNCNSFPASLHGERFCELKYYLWHGMKEVAFTQPSHYEHASQCIFLPAAKPAGQWMIIGLLPVKFCEWSSIRARKTLEPRLLMPLSSNLMSEVIQALKNRTQQNKFSITEARGALKYFCWGN